MPLTYLAMLFSFLVAINYPASRGLGPYIFLSREQEEKGSYQQNSDSIGRFGVKAQAGTDVNNPVLRCDLILQRKISRSCSKFSILLVELSLESGNVII